MDAARVWVAVQATVRGQMNNVMFRFAELCGADYLERFRGVLIEMRGVRGQALLENHRRDLEVEPGKTDRPLFIRIICNFIYDTNDVMIMLLLLESQGLLPIALCIDPIETGICALGINNARTSFALENTLIDVQRDVSFCGMNTLETMAGIGGRFNDAGFVLRNGRVLQGTTF